MYFQIVADRFRYKRLEGFVIEKLVNTFGETLFVSKPVVEVLYRGYYDPILSVQHLFDRTMPDKVAFFYKVSFSFHSQGRFMRHVLETF